MTEIFKSDDGMIELRCGRWQDVLADVESVDAVIFDAPFSGRTHAGHGSFERWGTTVPKSYDGCARSEIDYSEISPADVLEFCDRWCEACSGWMVSMTDDVLFGFWRDAMASHNRTVFQDVPVIVSGMTVRQSGDGPSSWAIHCAVSRPPALSRWGTLPGAYVGPREKLDMTGAKPAWAMSSLVRDYSRPGDLICDPCAGSGTTLIAAAIEGRRSIGSECDPETFAKAVTRIKRGYTPAMVMLVAKKAKQEVLL